MIHGKWLILLAALAAGCGERQKVQVGGPTSATASGDMGPVTAEEAETFGRDLADAFMRKDRDALKRALQFEAWLVPALAAHGVSLPQPLPAAYDTGGGFITNHLVGIEQGGNAKFIRQRESAGRRSALVRLLAPGGESYFEFRLARRLDGTVATEDIFSHTHGESLAKMGARFFLTVSGKGDAPVEALTEENKLFLEHFPRFRQIVPLVNAGRSEEALAIYKALPARVRRERAILFMGLSAAGGNPDEYAALIQDFREQFPGDPAIDFVTVQNFLQRSRFAEARRALAAMEKSIGGDGYLTTLRGVCDFEEGNLSAAVQTFDAAIATEPDFEGAYIAKARTQARLKDFAGSAETLRKSIENANPHLSSETITEADEFKDFIKSDEFAKLKPLLDK